MGVLSKLIIIFSFVFFTSEIGYGKTIDNWEGWCSQLLGEDLFKKYNTFAIKFDHKAIRADFVKKYNGLVVQDIAYKYLNKTEPSDEVVKELVRLKIIGVWNEENNLYLSNGLLIIDEILGINEFKEWEDMFRKYLNIRQNRQSMSDFQYCIFGTINTHFETFVLLGPENRSITIPLEFTCRKDFK